MLIKNIASAGIIHPNTQKGSSTQSSPSNGFVIASLNSCRSKKASVYAPGGRETSGESQGSGTTSTASGRGGSEMIFSSSGDSSSAPWARSSSSRVRYLAIAMSRAACVEARLASCYSAESEDTRQQVQLRSCKLIHASCVDSFKRTSQATEFNFNGSLLPQHLT